METDWGGGKHSEQETAKATKKFWKRDQEFERPRELFSKRDGNGGVLWISWIQSEEKGKHGVEKC